MRIVCVLASSLVLGSTSTALAYERRTVDDAPDRGLLWERRAIAIELAADTSLDVAPADLRAALGRSLGAWSAPACSDIALEDVGDAPGLATNLTDGARDGLHRIVVREAGWPAEVGSETLALTSIVYDRATGRILDADIDLNASTHRFSASEAPPPDADDVENTLTHELGHLLGFTHATDPEATMFGSAELGETRKRDLADDDLAALCETYPTGRATPPVVPRPPPAASACRASPGQASSPAALTLLAGIAASISASRLRARARGRARRRARAAGTAS